MEMNKTARIIKNFRINSPPITSQKKTKIATRVNTLAAMIHFLGSLPLYYI